MEPKFQSSFIPKGPLASSGDPLRRQTGKDKEKSLLSFLALVIFIISVVLAVGIFGYKFYLKYSINKMGTNLDQARSTLKPEIIRDLVRLDNRLISTEDLISKHNVLTPVFEFLEVSTPRSVRFRDFRYSMTERGIELQMKGEAQGYAALALQADIFSKSEYFKDSIFSDLILNDRGEVTFSFRTTVDPSLVSYEREIKKMDTPSAILPTESADQATSTDRDAATSTSSPQATIN